MSKISEADFEILSNINTQPGPNAGRSINPTKPGPNDTAPPRPDASGLIEAVELFLGERMREFPDSRAVDDDLVALAGVLAGDIDGNCLAFLRARAADRRNK